MVHIILLILKIAGIVLLSLLGILILLVLMVLFVPVRYNISADYHSRLTANIKISWLLNVLRLKASYANDLSVKAYAMFFKIFDNNSDKRRSKRIKKAISALMICMWRTAVRKLPDNTLLVDRMKQVVLAIVRILLCRLKH